MKEEIVSFGEKLTYKWKYIIIDPPFGIPILLDGKEIGGLFIRVDSWGKNIEVVSLEGIEIDPVYRGKGIGKGIVEMLKEQCTMIIGSITEDEPKPFWKKVGAELRDIPLDSFPQRMHPTIHTKEPKFFFITKNPEARDLAERFAAQLPDAMRMVEKLRYAKH